VSTGADTRDLVSSVRSPGAPQPGVLAVFSDGTPLLVPVPLLRGSATLGRDEARGIADDTLSRRHADVRLERSRWTVTDHGSRNGTYVNGARVTGTVSVDGPRVVRLAYTVYLLVDDVRPFEGATVTVDGDRVTGPGFAAALAAARRAAADNLLLTGESGAGKELAARAYHEAGGGGPFVAVNCAAIPQGVAERLLFGSTRGAFSDAVDAEGYIAAADGGVLFLDEIGELDPAVQAKLLRVVETREVVPLGASRGRRVTTRFCFATHRNLRSAMSESGFRPDLYYRIAHNELHLPALRERREEIPWLIAHELAGAGARAHARLVEECLLRAWPGNVRELRTAIRAAAKQLPAGERVVRPEHLDPAAGQPVEAARAAHPLEVSREVLEAAIAGQRGNLSAVARELKLHRSQLYRLLKQYGLSR
jgi:transcriptional regulator of acetoin/glycerol metabolism